MSERKRSRLEIQVDLLKALRKGTTKPTRLMYKTNLSWTPLKKYLGFLVNQGLVTVDDTTGHNLYAITDKGREVLESFNQFMEGLTGEPQF